MNFVIHFYREKYFLLVRDASPYNLAVFLSHRMPDGSEKSITFAPRILSQQNTNREGSSRYSLRC